MKTRKDTSQTPAVPNSAAAAAFAPAPAASAPAALLTAVPVLVFLALLGASCATEPHYAGSGVSTEGPVTIEGTSYYLAKGNTTSNINNVMFDWYAEHLSAVLSNHGMIPASYETADVVIMAEYGKKTYPDSSLVFRREYDRSANTTRWVHEETEPVEMPYISLTAVEGDAYRTDGSKERLWKVELFRKADDREAGNRQAEEQPFEESFPELLKSLWVYLAET
jgi:hypothetical protein